MDGLLVRLAGVWVLAGAVTKAFVGLPGDLPAPILAFDVDPILILVMAVGVETAVGLFAVLAPRRGWIPMSALLGLFALILGLHIRSGAESCGCFGGALPVPPVLMLAVDGGLLVGVLLTVLRGKPWRAQRSIGVSAILVLIAAGILAVSTQSRLEALQPKESTKNPAVLPSSTLSTPLSLTTPVIWKMPEEIPAQVLLRPSQWIGKPLAQTELGRWTDTSLFPPDATVVIYYLSCNHCAAHLKDLAQKQSADPQHAPKYVLVQLPTPSGYKGKIFVNELPTGLRVELPSQVKTWVITPPWNVFLKDGLVVQVDRTKWAGEK